MSLMQQEATSSRAVPATLAGAALAASTALYFVDPNRHTLLVCPLRETTGLWCPFCGATRATYAVMHGDFMTALHDNAMYVVAIPALLLLWVRWLATGSRTPIPDFLIRRPRMRRQVMIGFIMGATIFMTLRNIPMGHWFAPIS